MARTFTLDTSGVVLVPYTLRQNDEGIPFKTWRWEDLAPFQQGYVEGLFAHAWAVEREYHLSQDLSFGWVPRFSDLDPSALAMILADCEAYLRLRNLSEADAGEHGAVFWDWRQAGGLRDAFPPLTVFLSDEGRVCLRPAGEA